MASTLSEILYPLSLESFMSDYWSKSFLHLAGSETKYRGLFSWDLLSHVFNTHRLPPARMRIFKSGVQVAHRNYMSLDLQNVVHERVLSLFDGGCTLALDHAEEISLSLGKLIESIEKVLLGPVHANLYAAWKMDNGFPMHFDVQDALILALEGKKRWKIWNPTRLHPLHPDIEESPRPVADPIWSGELISGSMLYIPRGWWHLVEPVGEPCLHLTITMPNSSGVDFVHWIADELRCSEVARQNVPIWGDKAHLDKYLMDLLSVLRDRWSDEAAESYRQHSKSKTRSRPLFNFPELK